MRNAILLIPFLIFGCKQNSSNDNPVPVTPVKAPCPTGYYGENCDSAYADLMKGLWIMQDSVVVDYRPPSTKTDFAIINTHESILFDSGYHIDGGDTIGKRFYFRNFWGTGELGLVSFARTDTVMFYSLPPFNGEYIYFKAPISIGAYFCKANNYIYQYYGGGGSQSADKYTLTYIKMTKKP